MFTKTTIKDKFLQTIENNNLIDENDTIIIGASGGPDSQFLVYLLNEIKDMYKIKLVLAHLNHMHRKEAVDDENLVQKTAKKLGLDFHKDSKSMDLYAKKHSISSEHAGRILRYDFFEKVCKKYKNPKIAIAHNMDDQAETVLMRIIRGTGLDGLKAMEYKNGKIIRPIMDFSKNEILGFLDKYDIDYHIDKTNLEKDYTRNKIRLDVIPEIEKINPNFKKSLISLSEIAKDDYSILKKLEDDFLENVEFKKDFVSFRKKDFEKLSDPLKKRLIRRGISYIYGHINDFSKKNLDDFLSLVNLSNGKKIIKDDLVFIKNYKSYDLYKKRKDIDKNKKAFMDFDETLEFSNYKFKTRLIDKDDFSSIDKVGSVFFDYDKISSPLMIRFRENGDRFNFHGKKTKKLKDFFIDEKVDKNLRDRIPLVFIKDRLVWIVGYRRSDDFKISNKTKKILMLSAEDLWEKI